MDGFCRSGIGGARAFSYSDGSALLVYMSSSDAASCSLAANYLGASETRVEPSDLFETNHCNLMLKFTDPDFDWWKSLLWT